MTLYQHYAVYQSGYAIFGTGETREAAIADAEQWLDAETDLATISTGGGQRGEIHGNLYVAPCTAALAVEVHEHGGDIVYEINDDGTLSLGDGEDTTARKDENGTAQDDHQRCESIHAQHPRGRQR